MAAPTAQQLKQLTEELTAALVQKIEVVTDELEASTEAATTTTTLARVRTLQALTNELLVAQADLGAARKANQADDVATLEQRSANLIESLGALVHELKND